MLCQLAQRHRQREEDALGDECNHVYTSSVDEESIQNPTRQIWVMFAGIIKFSIH